MTDSRFAGRVALVTGAGGPHGIGFSTARILAAGGATLAIASTTARIHERVAELAATGVDGDRSRRRPDGSGARPAGSWRRSWRPTAGSTSSSTTPGWSRSATAEDSTTSWT